MNNICKICNKEFNSQLGLGSHLRTHKITKEEYFIKFFDEFKSDEDFYNDDYVVCPLCLQHYQTLTQHLRLKHNMTIEEFTHNYPNLRYQTETYRILQSSRGSKGMESRLKDKEKFRDSARKGHVTRKVNYGDQAYTAWLSSGHKSNSIRLKNLWKQDNYRLSQSIKMYNQHHNDPTFKLSKSIMSRNSVYEYNGYCMRSTWEVKFAKFLDEYSITYEYESLRFDYYYEKRHRSYYPDFYIPEYNLIVEVKPNYLINNEIVQIKKNSVPKSYNYMFITELENLSPTIFLRNINE